MQKRSVLLAAAFVAVVLPLSALARFWPPVGQVVPSDPPVPDCYPVDCPAPREGCTYENPTVTNGCMTNCGTLTCASSSSSACAGEGQPVYQSSQFGPTACCSKNAGIKPITQVSGDGCVAPLGGQKGTCVNDWWRTCGDKVCAKGEDKCNCPADCRDVGVCQPVGCFPPAGCQYGNPTIKDGCAVDCGTITCTGINPPLYSCGYDYPSGDYKCVSMDKAKCAAFHGTPFSSDAECWNNQMVVCGFKPAGGGWQCEDMNQDKCRAMDGGIFSSVNDCWNEAKVVCGFKPAGGGWQCEDTPTGKCKARGGQRFDSLDQCWHSTSVPVPPVVGGDRDKYGCIPSAGYSWCDAKQKCLRTWEEPCSGTTTTPSPSAPPAGYEDEVLTNIEVYKNPFPDTDMNNVSGKAAAELYRRAIIGGFPDGQFKGDRPVNRAEAAKFLILARFQAESSDPNAVANFENNGRFPDVLDGQWYTKYVIAAAQKGIINGNPDGTFRPANQVNTAEFLKMLGLTFGLQKNLPHSYTDVSSSDWFAPYAGFAAKYNLFPGRTSRLYPERPLTREEVAVAIYRYLSDR